MAEKKGNGKLPPNSIYRYYARDPSYEEEGKPCVLLGGSEWWVLPWGCPRMEMARARANQEFAEEIEACRTNDPNAQLPADLIRRILAATFGYGGVTKVTRLYGLEDKEEESNPEIIRRYLDDPHLSRIPFQLHEFSTTDEEFWPQFIREAEGNYKST